MLLFGSVCVFLALGNGARPAAGPSPLKSTVCSGSSWKWRGLDDQRLPFRASVAVVTPDVTHPVFVYLTSFGWKKGICMEAKPRIHWALDPRIPIVLAGALAKQFPDLTAGKPNHQAPWLHWAASLACLLI